MIRNMSWRRRLPRASLLALLPLLMLCPPAVAGGRVQSMRALIEQALDQQVDITLEKQPLAEAFKVIGEKTGVKLTLRPQVVELLPYGEQTQVSKVTMKNVSLREGLGKMLSHLGMTLRVRESDVAIEPTQPLRRICRRATWGELGKLQQLTATPWSPAAADGLELHFQVRSADDARKAFLAATAKVAPGSIADVLEAACERLEWTWYPWDNSIVIVSKADQAARFIEKPVSLRYNHAALADVFSDLASQADLRLRLEPGVLKGLPVQTRQNFSLMMREATIRTALEMIGGATGLAYDVTPEELVIKHTKVSQAAATQQATLIRSDDPIVGEVTVAGKSGVVYKFFIRQSDLSDELNKWRRNKIRETVKRMEHELAP